MYDLAITGGLVVDGTGAPGVRAGVGVRDGRIVAIGDLDGDAAEIIDATDRIVAPGFVDVHTHYDAQALWDPMMTISPWHGVTTVVLGNCGFGLAPAGEGDRDFLMLLLEKVEGMPLDALRAGIGAWDFTSFDDYLRRLERSGVGINVAVLLAHTPLRRFVMGEAASARAATAAEIAAMERLADEALAAGALGFSTSVMPFDIDHLGRPVPSRHAAPDEMLALAATLARAGNAVLHYNVGRKPPWDTLEALARASGGNVCWSFFVANQSGPGAHREGLSRTAAMIARGLPIYPQTACRPIVSTWGFGHAVPFVTFVPFSVINAAPDEGSVRRTLADPAFRARMRAVFEDADHPDSTFEGGGEERAMRLESLALTTIAAYPPDPAREGASVADLAAAAGVHPFDLMADMALASDMAARFTTPMMNYVETEVEEILTDPNVVLGLGDGGAHFAELNDACFPTDLLGRWVREKGVLTLERAVHMLTARPAAIFGLDDRGSLAVGRPADIVVFDRETVGAGPLERLSDLPAGADRLVSFPRGIDAVVVNGRRLPGPGGRSASPCAGRVLRRGRGR